MTWTRAAVVEVMRNGMMLIYFEGKETGFVDGLDDSMRGN